MDVNGTLLNNGDFIPTSILSLLPLFLHAYSFPSEVPIHRLSFFLPSFFLFLRLRYSLPRHKCGLITLGRPFSMRPVNPCSILERLSGLAFHDVA